MSIALKIRKSLNLLPRTYWISNSLDGAEHNKYIVSITIFENGTYPGYKVVTGVNFQEAF